MYPPSVKVFQLDQLAMYFERRFDNEIIDFIMLEDDWKKMAFLRADRYIEFHSRFGLHEKIRVPKFGRAMVTNFCFKMVSMTKFCFHKPRFVLVLLFINIFTTLFLRKKPKILEFPFPLC